MRAPVCAAAAAGWQRTSGDSTPFPTYASIPSLTSFAIFELTPPQRPLSDEMARASTVEDVSSSSLTPMWGIIRLCTDAANGRAFAMSVSAFLSLEAATIFIALVILEVEVTDLRRLPMSLTDGMALVAGTGWAALVLSDTALRSCGVQSAVAAHCAHRSCALGGGGEECEGQTRWRKAENGGCKRAWGAVRDSG